MTDIQSYDQLSAERRERAVQNMTPERQAHLKAAVAPLTDAMAHDENECRAAPWLFEVFLRLDMKEEAQWVWDKCCEVNQGLTVSLKNIAASVTRAQKLHAQRRR